MEPEILKILCDMAVELVRLRQNECKHLCVENSAENCLGNVLRAYNRSEFEKNPPYMIHPDAVNL